MEMNVCPHIEQLKRPLPEPRTPDGCEECLKTKSWWVHLRLCETCGHVGCCDNSPNRHATKHFGMNVFDPQGDVPEPGPAREPQAQVACGVFTDALGGYVAAKDVSLILHRRYSLPPSTHPSSFSARSPRTRPMTFWRCHRLRDNGAWKTIHSKTARR